MSAHVHQRQVIRSFVKMLYDIQALRMAAGLRVVSAFKPILEASGVVFKEELAEGEDKKKAEEKVTVKIMGMLMADYKACRDPKTGEIITSAQFEKIKDKMTYLKVYDMVALLDAYMVLVDREKQQFAMLTKVLSGHPLYEYIMANRDDWVGVGPAAIAVLISEIDIHNTMYPTRLFKYAGLDVAPDGRGRSRRSEHLIDVEYVDRNGNKQTKRSITFNPFLKTKLIGTFADSMIRAGSPTERNGHRTSRYKQIYLDYKHRITCREEARAQQDPNYVKWTKAHIHNAAKRYMIKRLLADIYNVWRRLENLPVAPSYEEAKLGLIHGQTYMTPEQRQAANAAAE